MGTNWKTYIVLALLALGLTARAEWTPRFDSPEERFEFLLFLMEKYPGIVASTMQSRQNLDEVLAKIPEVMRKLGPSAGSLTLGEQTRLTGSYVPGGVGRYDPERLEAVRASLKDDLEKLGLTRFEGLAKDLETLKQAAGTDQAKFQDKVSRLTRLMPLVYQTNGEPLATKTDPGTLTVEQLNGMSWEAYRPQIAAIAQGKGKGAILQSYEGAARRFVQADVKRATTLVDGAGKTVAKRDIALQSLPAAVAVFRAYFAPDCSLTSLPFWPLLMGSKAYAIQGSKDPKAPPKGYVFVIPAKVNGRTVPYVLTINGETLTAGDVEAASHLIAKDWGTTSILMPDLLKNANIVNTQEMRDGIARLTGRNVPVELDARHDELTKYGVQNPFEPTTFYDSSRLKEAKLVELGTGGPTFLGPLTSERLAAPERHAGDAETISVLDRALIAGQWLQRNPGALNQRKVLSALKLTENQYEAVKPILDAHPLRPLGAEDFLKAQRELGFRLDDVLNLDAQTRAISLGRLHRERPDLADPAKWKALTLKAWSKLDRDMAMLEHNPMLIEIIYDAKIALPYEHSPLRDEMERVKGNPLSPRHDPLRKALARRQPQGPGPCRWEQVAARH